MSRILKTFRDYFALRAHLRSPWAFVRSRKSPRPAGEVEIPFKNGFTVRCHTPHIDLQVLNGIFARDEYRLNGYPDGGWDTVIDIGAHIGLFSIRVAPLARRVLSFEPMPQNFQHFQQNVAGERFRHVIPIPKAVSGKAGPIDLYVSKNSGHHSMLVGAAEGSEKVRVEAVTLAQVFEEHRIERCSLLKLDCEGSEYDILSAVPDALWPRIERIHMEYHPGPPGWDGEKLEAFLRERGYACERVPRSRHAGLGNMFATRR